MVYRSASPFAGVIPIVATPFHEDDTLDLESLERLIRFNAAVGVGAITVLGVLGESHRLTDSERSNVVACAVKAARSLPVIAGTSHQGTAATIHLSRKAIEQGAAAVMILPPLQPVPSDEAVVKYFSSVAESVPASIVLQDHPAVSQIHMSVNLILNLVQEIPAIVSIKAECVPSPQRIAALKAGLGCARQPTVLSGLGALYGLFDLERGSDGFNTGFAFPEVLVAMLREFREGNLQGARSIFQRYLPLIVFEQQPGVAVRKEILRRRGLISSPRVRSPGASIDPSTSEQLASLLEATFGGVDIRQPLRIEP